MMGYGYGWNEWIVLLAVIVVPALFGLALWALVALTRGKPTAVDAPAHPVDDTTSLHKLEQRLGAGDITVTEFHEARQALTALTYKEPLRRN
jgi:uncharacterized membrane protein